MLFVTQHGVAFLMLSSDTRVMGRFVDVVCYDLLPSALFEELCPRVVYHSICVVEDMVQTAIKQ